MEKIIIKIEKFVFFRTGIIMPCLKRQWAREARNIQRGLDLAREHRDYLAGLDSRHWLKVANQS